LKFLQIRAAVAGSWKGPRMINMTLRGIASAVVLSALLIPPLALAPALMPAARAEPLIPRGEWSPETRYFMDDLVVSRGSTWRA